MSTEKVAVSLETYQELSITLFLAAAFRAKLLTPEKVTELIAHIPEFVFEGSITTYFIKEDNK